MSTVVLSPVQEADHWRVKLTWPGVPPRRIGPFNSLAEAEKWIAEHHWLTEQDQEPGADDPNTANDRSC